MSRALQQWKHIFFSCLLFFLVFAVLPGYAQISFPEGLSYENATFPGGCLEGCIPLRNNCGKPLKVKITHVDYHFNAKGENFFDPLGSVDRSNGLWMSLNIPTFLEIAPHSISNIRYKIKVPPNPSLEGSYWSVLLVQPQDQLEENWNTSALNHVGIRTVVQYGVHIITNVGSNGKAELKVLHKEIHAEGCEKWLTLDVENCGSLWVDPAVWLQLFDSKGCNLGRYKGDTNRLYPKCSARYRIDLSSVPPGSYKSLLVLDYGGNGVFGAKYDLEIP